MIKSKDELRHRPIEIDLTGPDGNVFVLMGYARQYAKQLFDKIEPEMEFEHSMTEAFRELYDEEFESAKDMGEFITNQMMESDYDHAVEVFDRYFGNVITLYR